MTEIEKAIEHFNYGITHDIFSEPVTTYSRLAVNALREQSKRDNLVKCADCYKRNTSWCPMTDWTGLSDDFFCSSGEKR